MRPADTLDADCSGRSEARADRGDLPGREALPSGRARRGRTARCSGRGNERIVPRVANSTQTLRTSMEPADKKMGAVSEKPRNGALQKFTHNSLVPGGSPPASRGSALRASAASPGGGSPGPRHVRWFTRETPRLALVEGRGHHVFQRNASRLLGCGFRADEAQAWRASHPPPLRLVSKVEVQTPPSNTQRPSVLSFRTAICHCFTFPSTRIL